MPDYKRLISRKIPVRKVSLVSPKAKRGPKIVFLLILGLLIVGTFFGGRFFLLHFSGFNISKVYIENEKGEALPNPEAIFRLDEEINLFSFKMKRVAEDIQARHPELAFVQMRKQFPNTLLIIVKRKEPVAVVGRQKSYLVDASGFILPFTSTSGHLPKIVGIHPRHLQLYAQSHSLRLKRALGLLKELKNAKIYPENKIAQINVSKFSQVVFYLEQGTEVKMGQGDFGRKATVLSEILSRLKASNTAPKYIDMRFADPVVKP